MLQIRKVWVSEKGWRASVWDSDTGLFVRYISGTSQEPPIEGSEYVDAEPQQKRVFTGMEAQAKAAAAVKLPALDARELRIIRLAAWKAACSSALPKTLKDLLALQRFIEHDTLGGGNKE